jgi:hypothetical protein
MALPAPVRVQGVEIYPFSRYYFGAKDTAAMTRDLETPADSALRLKAMYFLCFLKACSVLVVISVYRTVVSGGAVGSPARAAARQELLLPAPRRPSQARRHTLAIHLPCVCALSVSLRTQRNCARPAL